MINKEELLKRPNYLLTKYQNEIYRQLLYFMKANNYSQTDVAQILGVSSAYISQILNGNFNFTLKKLIELGLLMGKVPVLNFIDSKDYWNQEMDKGKDGPSISVTINIINQKLPVDQNKTGIIGKPIHLTTGSPNISKIGLEPVCFN